MTNTARLLTCIGMLSGAFAQQPTAPGNSDVFVSSSRGQAEAPAQAVRKLYELAAQITANPSSGYQAPRSNESDWPAEAEAQRQWADSMAKRGNDLSQRDRARLIPCAAHLNTAIDSMERGYRIEISQRGNPAAQQSVETLYARGRKEFSLCSPTDVLPAGPGDPGLSDAQRLQQLQRELDDQQRKYNVLRSINDTLRSRLEAECTFATQESNVELAKFSCDLAKAAVVPNALPAPAPARNGIKK